MFDPTRPPHTQPVVTELGTITHHVFMLGNHVYRHPLGHEDQIERWSPGVPAPGGALPACWRRVEEAELRKAA